MGQERVYPRPMYANAPSDLARYRVENSWKSDRYVRDFARLEELCQHHARTIGLIALSFLEPHSDYQGLPLRPKTSLGRQLKMCLLAVYAKPAQVRV